MDDVKAAVALITVGIDPHVLLVRRADNPNDPWSGHWALPGGRREEGETALETCIRECAEECGVYLNPDDFRSELPVSVAGRAMGRSLAVAPFHWHLKTRPALELQVEEIQDASYLSLADFTSWSSHSSGRLAAAYPEREYPYYEYLGTPLWGFTYRVIKDWAESGI